MAFDLMELLDGNMIRGAAADGADNGGDETVLIEEYAGRIAGAFAYWLTYKVNKNPVMLKVCIGYDDRPSADMLKSGVMKGLTIFGPEAHDAGLATTPAMFMSTVMPQFEFDGAIMITGGDEPDNINGFRLFTVDGSLKEEEIREVLRLANRYTFVGEYFEDRPVNLMQMYGAYLRQNFSMALRNSQKSVRGKRIAVCTGNMPGEFFAKQVLRYMGAEVIEVQGSVQDAVRDTGAELGLAFNTDGSRVTAVMPDGQLIDGDDIFDAAGIPAQELSDGNFNREDGDSIAMQLVIRMAGSRVQEA